MDNEWLKDFKISLINEDIDSLIKLISGFKSTKFENLEQLNEALSLTKQTQELFKIKKIHIENEIQKLQNARKYAN